MSDNNEELPNIFNESGAAKYLSISATSLRTSRVRTPTKRKNLMPTPPYIKMGRAIRYLRKDLDEFLEKHRITE